MHYKIPRLIELAIHLSQAFNLIFIGLVFANLIDNPIPHATIKIKYLTRAEKLKARIFKMLTFQCIDCNETINGDDYESADQIFGRLEDHVRKCCQATFTFDGTTDVARQRLGAWRSVIEKEHLVGRLRLH